MDSDGILLTAGLDEAGLGPIAGPAVFGVSVLRDDAYLPSVKDSKKLSDDAKYTAAVDVLRESLHYGVIVVPVSKIDQDGVGMVWQQAMYKLVFSAVARLPVDRIVVDGNKKIRKDVSEEEYSRGGDYKAPKVEYIVKADATVLAVSAASILAKCEQLEQMELLHERYPDYGFGGAKGHHGYGVPSHVHAIAELGAIRGVHREQYVETLAKNQGFELRWRKP